MPRAALHESGTITAEVVIVGAGPAGSSLAAQLADRGRDVLLVDRGRFPRPKPCGECLNPGAVASLARTGLLPAVLATDPVPLSGWLLTSPGGARAWAGFPGSAHGYGVDRGSLDWSLLGEARRRGARFLEGVHVKGVDHGTGLRGPLAWGTDPSGNPVRLACTVLVGADGLRSVVARGIGALRRPPKLRKVSLTWRVRGRGPDREQGRLFLGGDLTVGLAPVPGGGSSLDFWNATLVASTPGKGAGGILSWGWERARDRLRSLAGPWLSGPEVVDGPWASGPFDWPMHSSGKGAVLLVGDAAGYYDPLTGQGIFRALRGGELAAPLIDDALPAPRRRSGDPPATPVAPKLIARYDRELARVFGPGHGIQRAIEELVSRPSLREPALFLLERWPAAGSLVARVTGDIPFGALSCGGRNDAHHR